MLSLSKHLCLLLGMLLFAGVVRAQEFANIEYLCADWGPAMKWSAKTNEPPVYSETEEEIYFLKQVGRFTRKKAVPDLFTGKTTREVGKGISIYLCKMKPDGSEKTELKELWRNPNYAIDTQGQSTWMDVIGATRKIVLSITHAGSDITGLWTMNLDGSNLKRIITPAVTTNYLQAINHPSWTPDGQWIVFEEERRGTNPNQHRIAKCDLNGEHLVYLTNGPWQRQPAVSPDGKTVVYVQVGDAKTGGVYLMSIDGDNSHLLPNPTDKRRGKHSGTHPTWSPDGGRILLTGGGLIDVESGKAIFPVGPFRDGKERSWGWAHWGKSGIVGYNVSGLWLTDSGIKEQQTLGISQLLECQGGDTSCKW